MGDEQTAGQARPGNERTLTDIKALLERHKLRGGVLIGFEFEIGKGPVMIAANATDDGFWPFLELLAEKIGDQLESGELLPDEMQSPPESHGDLAARWLARFFADAKRDGHRDECITFILSSMLGSVIGSCIAEGERKRVIEEAGRNVIDACREAGAKPARLH